MTNEIILMIRSNDFNTFSNVMHDLYIFNRSSKPQAQ